MSTTFKPGTFTPAPKRTSAGAMLLAHGTMEAKLMLRHGEQLLVNVLIPAAILLDDMDVAATMPMLLMSGLMNSGQACVAQTRILAPRSRYDEILEAMVTGAGFMAVGDPSDPATALGPLISEKQRDRVEAYIAKGKEEGARVVLGGGRPAGLDRGWFVEPTVFADVDNQATVAREEIFGPVAPITTFATDEEAIRLANSTEYGLVAYVFTENTSRTIRVAEALEFGMVGINQGVVSNPSAPFGGVKHSGFGREGGFEGIEEYLETKAVARPA